MKSLWMNCTNPVHSPSISFKYAVPFLHCCIFTATMKQRIYGSNNQSIHSHFCIRFEYYKLPFK
jgi:hypothetical protein